jgi:hypothetical protein
MNDFYKSNDPLNKFHSNLYKSIFNILEGVCMQFLMVINISHKTEILIIGFASSQFTAQAYTFDCSVPDNLH